MQTIYILSNNSSAKGFRNEHGFSLLIKYEGKNILFDTGNGTAFIENSIRFNIKSSDIDYLILSHGHYDHCGNINYILNYNPDIKTYIHKDALNIRYSIHQDRDPKVSSIGISKENKKAIQNSNTIYTEKPIQIYRDLHLTGGIPRLSGEDSGGPFFYDTVGLKEDIIPDDQSIWINTEYGLIIITGCCHSGLINTVEYIRNITGQKKVSAIIGGLHLSKANNDRIKKTTDYINSLNLNTLYPAHCTGAQVSETLAKELSCKVIILKAGDTIKA